MTENDKKEKFLITTAIDYTNDVIHIGQAYEKILADSVARYYRMVKGDENVFFVTGTDEHGITNQKAAEKRGVSVEEHVTEISAKDKEQIDTLNISYDRFIRTTDSDHKKIAAEFFKKSWDNGKIYKNSYKGLYCEGCEAYKTLSELNENGQCPLHPTREIQEYEEENYFFKWSEYQSFLREVIETDKLKIFPEGKKKEMLAFIENGIEDIPITRPKFKLPWGITVPNDESQVIYVWFDALINYVTAARSGGLWGEGTKIVHFVGKDVARWHALLWPAMLESVGYRLPNVVYVHGFINLEGRKISKSLGNVIRPTELVEKYGTDAVRYYFLKHGPITEDVDISLAHFEEIYNGDLANGLGNTVSRVAKMAEKSGLSFPVMINKSVATGPSVFEPMQKEFRVDMVIQNIWTKLTELDKHVNENEPWNIKDEKELQKVLQHEVNEIRKIRMLLEPFMPETTEKIHNQFSGAQIRTDKPLFPRIS